MENEVNVVNGAYAPEFTNSDNTEIVPVNNGYEEDEDEITAGQAAVGLAMGFGLSVALWEGGKWLWRKAIRPTAIKLGEKAKASLEKENAEKAEKAGNTKASEDVIEGVDKTPGKQK